MTFYNIKFGSSNYFLTMVAYFDNFMMNFDYHSNVVWGLGRGVPHAPIVYFLLNIIEEVFLFYKS